MKTIDKKSLIFYLANKYYKFLFVNHRAEILALADSLPLFMSKSDLQENSRFIQRELYRLAKELGWFRNKQNSLRWEKRERSYKNV